MQILWRNRLPEVRLPKEAVKKLRHPNPALIAKLSASIGPKLIINGLIFRQTGSVAPTFTIVNAVHKIVNAVHKMPKICERRSQFDFENF
jgi:hypothetical protein